MTPHERHVIKIKNYLHLNRFKNASCLQQAAQSRLDLQRFLIQQYVYLPAVVAENSLKLDSFLFTSKILNKVGKFELENLVCFKLKSVVGTSNLEAITLEKINLNRENLKLDSFSIFQLLQELSNIQFWTAERPSCPSISDFNIAKWQFQIVLICIGDFHLIPDRHKNNSKLNSNWRKSKLT